MLLMSEKPICAMMRLVFSPTQGMTAVPDFRPLNIRSMRPFVAVAMLLGLAACGDTSSNWEPQDMMAAPTQAKGDDRYRAMIDFKAPSRDDSGKG